MALLEVLDRIEQLTARRALACVVLGSLVATAGSAEARRDLARASKPTIRGPSMTSDRTPTFRLSWAAPGVAPGSVRFECAVDSDRLRRCGRVYRPRLAVGRHVLRVRAHDRLGHRSATAVRRLTIRPAGPRVTGTVTVGGLPWGITPAGGSLWVADFEGGRVLRIDPTAARVRSAVQIGGGTGLVASGPGDLWATSFLDNRVSRIDPVSGRVVGTTSVGPGPGSAVAGFGSLWVASKGCTDPAAPCPGSGTVSRVDPATMSVLATIPVGREPRYLAVDERSVWVTSFYSDMVQRIDPATNTVAGAVTLPGRPNGVAVASGSLWVAGYDANAIWRLDPATLQRVATVSLPAGSGPEGITAEGTTLWVANASAGSVSRVGMAGNRVLSTIPVGREPRAIAFTSGAAWVTNLRSGTVSRIATGRARSVGLHASALKPRRPPYRLRQLARLARPTHVATPPTPTGKLFIVQKAGLIRVFTGGRLQQAPFLDLRSQVWTGIEQGLLSVAFHPDFASNGLLYVCYTEPSYAVVVAEYRSDGTRANPDSARVLVRVPHEDSSFHNGGQLLFGPDGRLYVGIGDGGYTRGDQGRLIPDPRGNGQNLDVLLGKIFALDVSAANPRPELVAYGLRNPWRFSLDPGRNALVIGDVGWNRTEEIDYLRLDGGPPANFGWSVYEGRSARVEAGPLNPTGELTWPVRTYEHVGGNCSITGGFVYRGSVRSLRGRYLFGDYCSGRIWSLRLNGGRASGLRREPLTVPGLASFGEDARGELYVVSVDRGRVYKLVRR